MREMMMILAAMQIAFVASSRATSLEDIFGDTIINSITLNVPSDYSTIQDALLFLDDKEIASSAIVTIQIADGTYNSYSTVYITHQNGDRIHIVGNTSDPSQVVINFSSNGTGFTCDNGKQLGFLGGVTIKSDGTGIGILATRNSTVYVDDSVIVDNFNTGVNANWSSVILTEGAITVKNCTTHGVLAHNATIKLSSSTVTGNVYGIFANAFSYIQFESGSTTNNTYGIYSVRGSYVDKSGTTFSGNTTNEFTQYSGTIDQ